MQNMCHIIWGLRMDSARKLRFFLSWTLLAVSARGLVADEVAEKLSLRPSIARANNPASKSHCKSVATSSWSATASLRPCP